MFSYTIEITESPLDGDLVSLWGLQWVSESGTLQQDISSVERRNHVESALSTGHASWGRARRFGEIRWASVLYCVPSMRRDAHAGFAS